MQLRLFGSARTIKNPKYDTRMVAGSYQDGEGLTLSKEELMKLRDMLNGMNL